MKRSEKCNDSTQQLLLDLENHEVQEVPRTGETGRLKNKIELRRASIAWLLNQGVSGIGCDVSTRFKKFKAEVAAFWNQKGSNKRGAKPKKVNIPQKTVVILCRDSRQACWPDFVQSTQLVSKLKTLRLERDEIEKELRETEPELRDTSTLFEEFTDWHYEKSRNPRYINVIEKIANGERALYKGSIFENVFNAKIADYHYLAVPSGTVQKNELPDGWGLLWIDKNYTVKIKSEATDQHCPLQNQYHLIQNIASAGLRHVLFKAGIDSNNGSYKFTRPPRKHRSNRHTITVAY